jgi:hypothetical protein
MDIHFLLYRKEYPLTSGSFDRIRVSSLFFFKKGTTNFSESLIDDETPKNFFAPSGNVRSEVPDKVRGFDATKTRIKKNECERKHKTNQLL